MKFVSFATALCALAGVASADVTLTGGSGNVVNSGLTLMVDTGGQSGADVTIRRYDEWTSPPSTLNSIFNTGDQEIADDLTFVPQIGVGLLTNLGFAVANSNGPVGSAFTGGQVRISFYDLGTGNVIPSAFGFTAFTANLPALNLAPNGSTRLSFGAAGAQALNGLGWLFGNANGVYASLKYTTVTGTGGFTIANAGMQARNGGIIGSSTDNLYGIGPGPNPTGAFNFAGTPYADSAWFIETNDFPAPGSFALLGLGGLFAARRRRS